MSVWTNKTSGVAARNGTTSHTVTFPASAAGSLLVVVVGMAATTTISGFTKPTSAVNATECAVFTRTGSSLSSLTMTHGGTNFPCSYVIYEFPSGSTFASGTSVANVAHTTVGPTLSGLSGVNTIFAAESTLVSSGDASIASTWTTPSIEDIDSFTAFATTGGAYLAVAYTDGYSAQSFSPFLTDTSGANRTQERISFAINVPGVAAQLTPTASYPVYQTSSNNVQLISPAFTPDDGELLVVKCSSASTGQTLTAAGGGLTWLLKHNASISSHCGASIFTAKVDYSVVNPGLFSVTVSASGTSLPHSMVVERWPNAMVESPPDLNNTKTGTGAPSTTVFTGLNGSVVTWLCADWAAVNGSSRAYLTTSATPIEEGYTFTSGQYTAEYAYQRAPSSGSQTLGLSAPTGQTWTMLGIEIEIISTGTPLTATASLSLSATATARAPVTSTASLSLLGSASAGTPATGTASLSLSATGSASATPPPSLVTVKAATSSFVNSGGVTQVITYPGTPVVGDPISIWITGNDSTMTLPSGPTGWTVEYATTVGTGSRFFLHKLYDDGSVAQNDGTSVSVTFSKQPVISIVPILFDGTVHAGFGTIGTVTTRATASTSSSALATGSSAAPNLVVFHEKTTSQTTCTVTGVTAIENVLPPTGVAGSVYVGWYNDTGGTANQTATYALTGNTNGCGYQIPLVPATVGPAPGTGSASISLTASGSAKVAATASASLTLTAESSTPIQLWMQQARWYVAHRGGSVDWPEETLYAYAHAAAWNSNLALEVSVWQSSDGVWVCSHDQSTARMFGTNYDIPTTAWATMSGLTTTVGAQPIARLVDVLATYATGNRVLMIDDKGQQSISAFLDLLDSYGGKARFISKGFCTSTAVADAATARGYQTWGYYYDADVATNLPATASHWSLLGMDYTATSTDWSTILTYGKPVLGHIIDTTAAGVTAFGFGAKGIVASGVMEAVPNDTPTATASLTLTASGSAKASPAGTASLSLAATGSAVTHAAVTSTGSLSLLASGSTAAPVAGTASVALSASGTAAAPVTGNASLTLGATGSAISHAAVTATATLALSASGTAVAPVTGTASLALTATGTAVSQSTISGTAALSLLAVGTATPAGSTGAASLALAASGAVGTAVAGSASLTLAATGSAVSHAAVTGTAALALVATGALLPPAVSGAASLILAATGSAVSQVAVTGTAVLALAASGEMVAPALGSATLALAASAAVRGDTTGSASIVLLATGTAVTHAAVIATASLDLAASGSAGTRAAGSAAFTLVASGSIGSSTIGSAVLDLLAVGDVHTTIGGTASLALLATGAAISHSTAAASLSLLAGGSMAALLTAVASIELAATGLALPPGGGNADFDLLAVGTAGARTTAAAALSLLATATTSSRLIATAALTLAAAGEAVPHAAGSASLVLLLTGTLRAAVGTGAASLVLTAVGTAGVTDRHPGTATLSLAAFGALQTVLGGTASLALFATAMVSAQLGGVASLDLLAVGVASTDLLASGSIELVATGEATTSLAATATLLLAAFGSMAQTRTGPQVIGVWDGSTLRPAILLGVWNGTTVEPATVLEVTS